MHASDTALFQRLVRTRLPGFFKDTPHWEEVGILQHIHSDMSGEYTVQGCIRCTDAGFYRFNGRFLNSMQQQIHFIFMGITTVWWQVHSGQDTLPDKKRTLLPDAIVSP